MFIRMSAWAERSRKQQALVKSLLPDRADPGVRAFAVNPPSLGQSFTQQPIQVVVGGSTYEELAEWRDIMLDRLRSNPKVQNITTNFEDTKPELRVHIRRNRASDLGVSIEAGAHAGDDAGQPPGHPLHRSRQGIRRHPAAQPRRPHEAGRHVQHLPPVEHDQGADPLSNLVTVSERGGPSPSRVDRLRAFTLGTPASGVTLGEALDVVETVAREVLPAMHASPTRASRASSANPARR